VEELYDRFVGGAGDVPAEWERYFDGLANGNDSDRFSVEAPFARRSVFNPSGGDRVASGASFDLAG
jgi:hypothetical protein